MTIGGQGSSVDQAFGKPTASCWLMRHVPRAGALTVVHQADPEAMVQWERRALGPLRLPGTGGRRL